eukprot:TRINITY_DN110724_c0_g1_i1.p1 TRINITY_DN110724_c0_g1~~TRINITY_DN110724_c0_g1_i1.p1  ORF type:complete len:1207 (+),score=276.99 TRINITY_DN110724_c0_g1_i1:79-3699(+)
MRLRWSNLLTFNFLVAGLLLRRCSCRPGLPGSSEEVLLADDNAHAASWAEAEGFDWDREEEEFVVADDATDAHDDGRGQKVGDDKDLRGDLEQWLAEVRVRVPDEALPTLLTSYSMIVKTVPIEVQLKNFKCSHIRLGKEGRPPFSAGMPGNYGGFSTQWAGGAFSISVVNVNFNCSAEIHYKANKGGILSAEGVAAAHFNIYETDFGVRVQPSSNDTQEVKVPNVLDFEDCSSKVNLDLEITDEGSSGWTKVATRVPGVLARIKDAVTASIEEYLCVQALDRSKASGERFLKEAHDKLRELIDVPMPDTTDHCGDHCVNWEEDHRLQWFSRFQEEYLAKQGVFDTILKNVYPEGVCIIGEDKLCLSGNKCIFGGADRADECVFAWNLKQEVEPIPTVLTVELQAGELQLKNTQLSVLKPENRDFMRSRADLDSVKLTFNMGWDFEGMIGHALAKDISAVTRVDLQLHGLFFEALIRAHMDKDGFETVLPHHRLEPNCFMPYMTELHMQDVTANCRINMAKVSLIKNTLKPSPLLSEFVAFIDNIVQALASHEDVILGALVGFLRTNITDYANDLIGNMSASWLEGECPEPLGEETEGGTKRPLIDPILAHDWAKGAFGLFWVVVVSMLCYLTPLCARKAQTTGAVAQHVLTATPARHVVNAVEGANQSEAWDRLWFCDALCMSTAVPRFLSLSVLLSLFMAICLLVTSNYLLAAETYVALEMGGKPSQEPPVSENVYQVMVFSVIYSIARLLAEPSMQFLGVILLLFSGVLPYFKLLAMVFCWVVPVRLCSTRTRGNLLLVLDQLGKLSLIDIFVIQLISAVLFTIIPFAGLDKDKAEAVVSPLNIGLRTNQEVGFSAFVAATVIALTLGHVLLFYQECDPLTSLQHSAQAGSKLTAHWFRKPRSLGEIHEKVTGRKRNVLVCVLLVCTSICFVVGIQMTWFTVQLVAPIDQCGLQRPGCNTEAAYSMMSFAAELPHMSQKPYSFAARFSQATFVIFAIGMNQLHLGILVVAWFGRLSPKGLARASSLAHSLFAWSALDVTIISSVLTAMELNNSNFVPLPPSTCKFIDKFREEPLEIEEMNGNMVCRGMRISCTLQNGTYVLAIGVILHMVLGRMLMSVLEEAVVVSQEATETKPHQSIFEVTSLAPLSFVASNTTTSRDFEIGSSDDEEAAHVEMSSRSPAARAVTFNAKEEVHPIEPARDTS